MHQLRDVSNAKPGRDSPARVERNSKRLVAFGRYGRIVEGQGTAGPIAGQPLRGLDADPLRARELPDKLVGVSEVGFEGAEVEWFRDGIGGLSPLSRARARKYSLCPPVVLMPADLPDYFIPSSAPAHRRASRPELIERDALVGALEAHRGDASAAARDLSVPRATIYRRLGKYRQQHDGL